MGTLVATLVVGPVADPASHLVHLAAPQAELTDDDIVQSYRELVKRAHNCRRCAISTIPSNTIGKT